MTDNDDAVQADSAGKHASADEVHPDRPRPTLEKNPGAAPNSAPVADAQANAAFARPAGVLTSFDTASSAPPPVAAPAVVSPPSPAERAAFGPPPGAIREFDAPLGARLDPRHAPISPPVHPALSSAFGRSVDADERGFAAPSGSRLVAGNEPGSPWWKANAASDPWRDPNSVAWLGRPAVFTAGTLTQVEPEEDVETDPDAAVESTADAEPPAPTGRYARFGFRALTLSIVVALLAGVLGGGVGFWLAHRAADAVHDSHVKLAEGSNAIVRAPGSVADIAKRVSPAVVSIDIRTSTEAGTGSGVIIDKNGYILTNNHVVSAAANDGTIKVTFSDNTTEAAKIVGRDPMTDLAVLKVTNSHITVATLGDSSKIAVGDPVVAIGSPLGLTGTVTTGIVSALDRPVHLSGEGSDTDAVVSAIQTDAAINPGNSGGALVDATGAIIGINSAIASLGTQSGSSGGSIGLGFAIPINFARSIATQLIQTGKVVHTSIGLSARSVTDGSRDGAYVVQVSPGGPSEKAGVKTADVITAVDGNAILSADMLSVEVQNHKPGDVVKLHIFRGAKELDIPVTLGSA
ncbi:S1-C subfamily serine protease [Jatrophihabitans sp. GAS493]|uniref:S1C family serine protease n=1 Tax=Jatrophihabitans sp. GAS493 TaxID=1907575 RepID=UPI000BB75112|nr:trypsin-like peptidase domain-containing protein [Jatrophihabitans sp. GAS493]SOD73027.1 S1-C subfamily serine protease [Jatrophihabitans sp. GAS493]